MRVGIELRPEMAFLCLSLYFFMLSWESVFSQQLYHLNFGMYERPPGFFKKENFSEFSSPNNDTRTLYEGIWVEAVEWLSLRSKFSYTMTPAGTNFGQPILMNGKQTWSGLVGRILKGDFDIISPPVVFSIERNEVVDCVGIADTEDSAFLTPALTEKSTLLSTVKPFQLHVWIMIMTSLLAVALCFAATSYFCVDINYKKKSYLLSLGDHLLYVIGTLTNQGEILAIRRYRFRLPFRIVCAVWGLFAVVVVNLYSSTLTSYTMARKMNLPPGGALEAMDEGILANLLLDDGIGRALVMNAKTGRLKQLADTFRQHPERFVSREEAFLKVASGCCAYSDLISYLEYRSAKDFKQHGKCRVHIGTISRGYGFVGLVIRKAHPHRDELNKGLLNLYQNGLLNHWRAKYTSGDASLCRSSAKKKSNKLRRFNLHDMVSTFLVLGIGLVASFTAFVAEQAGRLNRVHKLSRIPSSPRAEMGDNGPTNQEERKPNEEQISENDTGM